MAAGANTFQRVKEDINLSSKDAAIRLYKLVRKNYADYEIRNAKLTLALTEGGFKLTGFVPKKQQPPEMVRKASPHFIEITSYMHIGRSTNRLEH